MTQERIRELTKGMLRKKFYVILSKGGAAPEQLAEHLQRRARSPRPIPSSCTGCAASSCGNGR